MGWHVFFYRPKGKRKKEKEIHADIFEGVFFFNATNSQVSLYVNLIDNKFFKNDLTDIFYIGLVY